MRAFVLGQVNEAPGLSERARPTAGKGQVVVGLKAAALNRRDYWITRGLYPGIRCPVVLGSDGAGVIVEVGAGASRLFKGQEVLINPGLDWGPSEEVQGPSFRILGMPDDGTLAEAVAVPAESVHPKPGHLSWEEAAALPLAGVTAFRAVVSRGRVQAGETVLITGIGGGVATMALVFARACGAKVLVTSSSRQKIEQAIKLGALGGYDYRTEGWWKLVRAEHGEVRLIIDGAGGAGQGALVDLIAPGGRIVHYGSTAGAPEKLDLFKVFWKQITIMGTTMGSPADFRAMLELVNRKRLRPVIDEVYSLDGAGTALDRMARSDHFGKLVVRV